MHILIFVRFCRDLEYVTNLSNIIESNRAGIFVDNLVSRTSIPSHNCERKFMKRYINLITPCHGVVLFNINRLIFQEQYLGHIICPNDNLVIGDKSLRLTSTTFFRDGHFTIALSADKNRLIIHDDLKDQCDVSPYILQSIQ